MRTGTGWIITSQKLQYPENKRNKLHEIKELGLDKGTPSIYFVSIKGGLPTKLGTSSKVAHWRDRGVDQALGLPWPLGYQQLQPCNFLLALAFGIPISIHIIGTCLCRYLVQTFFLALSKPQSPGLGLQWGQLCRETATTSTHSLILSVCTVYFNKGQGC